MSVKIHVSYETEEEMRAVLTVLQPVMDSFRIRKSTGKPPYNHLYFTPKNSGKPCGAKDSP